VEENLKGWKVIARNKKGEELLRDTYAKPGRQDKLMTRIQEVSKDPLTFTVTFRSKQISKLLGRMPEEMKKQVYESFMKHSGKPIHYIKKALDVVLL
jgi:hypothetical protein